ncbi:acyltransferase family protein [Aurantiacibacter spongiae]|uniref:acyltransferase family protein n=1 Tax=Aurantiacibacter spongiae TaxID=2488860 RepID=UPI0013159B0D|nr:acyltransferase family protein [Aurantiacibacter spongiae]
MPFAAAAAGREREGAVYRSDIDGLRCLAVVPLVLCHTGIAGLSSGLVGVDIVFVISGLLITGILASEIERGTYSIAKFYERRARRILPAVLTVILACLVGGWFILLPDEYVALGKSAIAAIGFASNIRFLTEGSNYFGADVAFDPLLHTWSLAVEEQFYLVFPVLLVALSGRHRHQRLRVLAALCAISFAISVWGAHRVQMMAFYLSPLRLWELGLGSLLALGAIPPATDRRWCEAGGIAGLFLIAASIALLTENSPFPGLAALPVCLGTVLLIWSGASGTSLAARLLSLRPFVLIGLVSYSLYLWHWPLIVLFRLRLSSADLPLSVALMAIGLSFVFAWLSWRYVEQPFRRPRKPVRTDRARALAWSGAAMAGVAAAATVPLTMDGFPDRLPAPTQLAYSVAKARGTLSLEYERMERTRLPCAVGEDLAPSSEPDLVIWGDSHSLAMVAAFDEILDEQGLSGLAYVRPSCAAMVGLGRTDKDDGEQCERHNRRVLEEIERLSGDETVILISRWALLTEGERSEGEAGIDADLAEMERARQPEDASNPALVLEGLDMTVRELTDDGVDVIVMRPTPEFGYDIPKAMARRTWTGVSPRAVDRGDYVRRAAETNAIIDTVIARYNAKALSPADVLCPDDCRTQLGDRILYRDDDHLSLAGSEWLLREMMRRGVLSIPDTPG